MERTMMVRPVHGWDPKKEKMVQAAIEDPDGFYRAVNPRNLPPKVEEMMEVIDHVNEDTRTRGDTAKGAGMGAMARGMGVFDDPLTLRKDNPKLPPWREIEAKFLVTKDPSLLTQLRREVHGEIRTAEQKLREIEQEYPDMEAQKWALTSLMSWGEAEPSKLERANGSLWHKLREAYNGGRILSQKARDSGYLVPFFAEEPQVFVVEHRWAAAFSGAQDFDGGEWRPPYDRCCFEFQIDGHRVIVVMIEDATCPSGFATVCAFHAQGDYWWCGIKGDLTMPPEKTGHEKFHELNRILHENVRAICIALEAEVAVTEVVRAPHKLNALREKKGRVPISDHRIVRLVHRSRVEPLVSAGDEPRWKVRLHFRRGHWRHFENHKTWVRWCLVGDPDLGFVDKEYRA